MKKEVKKWFLSDLDINSYDGRIEEDLSYGDDIDLKSIEKLNKINPEKYPDESKILDGYGNGNIYHNRKKNVLKQIKVHYTDDFYCLFDYDSWVPLLERNYWFDNDGSDNEMIIINYLFSSIEDSKGNKFDFKKELEKYLTI